MATKKVAPRKYVRKTAKKATKKTTKRVSPLKGRKLGPRKPKLQEEANSVKETQATEVHSNLSVLREIEVINLRGLSAKDRFGILCMLDSEGYITVSVESLLLPEFIIHVLKGEDDVLVLNHQNKLVSINPWEEVSHSSRISRPSLRFSVEVGFSEPGPEYLSVINIGDAQYMRIS